jgi:hypothetical protein
MKIKILFDTGLELPISVCTNEFSLRWLHLLEQEILKDNILQIDTYSSLMKQEAALTHLTNAIVLVNEFLKKEFIKIPNNQDLDSRDYYNYLHTKFEQLAGPSWDNPTRLMQIAPENIKLAVKHVNRFCHRLENRPYVIESYLRVEFNTSEREPLLDRDYDKFEIINEPGVMVLDYSTLGKSLYDCFKDNLTPSYPNMKHQHHYSANFKLKFAVEDSNDIEQFREWMQENNLTDLPQSVIGEIKLGTFDASSFEQVQKTSKILGITIN